jgi:hypothetical protein
MTSQPKLKTLRRLRTYLSRFILKERGYLLAEVLLTIGVLIALLGTIIMNYNNTNVVQDILETSQSLQIREYTKLYKKIAPQIAETLPIGGTVRFSIDSPNYLPYKGTKFLNLYEDYSVDRTQISEPLRVYNSLHNMTHLEITRSDINTYQCVVNMDYYSYKKLQQFRYETGDATKHEKEHKTGKSACDCEILNVNGDPEVTFVRGTSKNYNFTFSGEIIPQKTKEVAE